jgi:hypothetical protein
MSEVVAVTSIFCFLFLFVFFGQ